MEISYQIFEKEHFVIQKYAGKFSYQKYAEYTQFIMPQAGRFRVKAVINDMRELDIKFDDNFEESMKKMIDLRKGVHKENPQQSKDTTIIFWVTEPVTTVIAQIVSMNFADMKFYYCTTEASIRSYIDVPDTFPSLDNLTKKLTGKYQFQNVDTFIK